MQSRLRPVHALLALALVTAFAATCLAAPIDIVFGPEGGFAPTNNERTYKTLAGNEEPLRMNAVVVDWVNRTPDAGAIRMAMYNFDYEPVFEALLAAAKRGVQVRLILDNCAGWTDANVTQVKSRIKGLVDAAKAEGKPVDYQLKVITIAKMKEHKRTRTLDDGKEIFGTFHQKFGVFHEDKTRAPRHAFGGSANLSESSDSKYAENRVFFRDEPAVARAYANQFAKMWNDYSEPATEKCDPEEEKEVQERLPLELLFNADRVGKAPDSPFKRIDERISGLMDEVRDDGSLDLMMFSFTHYKLAMKLLDVAKAKPNAKFRLLFDHSMLEETPEKKSLMPPLLETKAVELGLKNLEIRYKFRANAYGYSSETQKIELDHFRSKLLHHKVMIVNGEKCVFGSYNWSGSAEERNFEDAFVFSAAEPAGKDVITRFKAEFDFLWDRYYGGWNGEGERPYTISGPEGRAWAQRIIQLLKENAEVSKIRDVLDKSGASTLKQIAEETNLKADEVEKLFAPLLQEKLIKTRQKKEKLIYELAD